MWRHEGIGACSSLLEPSRYLLYGPQLRSEGEMDGQMSIGISEHRAGGRRC